MITTKPPAPPLDDSHFLTHAQKHLNNRAVYTPFISLTSSFIWAIHKAKAQAKESHESPVIAVIDARIAARSTVIDHAAPIRQQLQSLGRAPKHYKANFEWLAWGQMSGEGLIIGEFSIKSLHDLCLRSSEVASMLRMHIINPDLSMARVRHTLALGSASSLTRDLGTGIGMLAKFICPSTHLHDLFVADLTRVYLQNWCVTDDLQGWLSEEPFVDGIDKGIRSQVNIQLVTPRSTPNPQQNFAKSSDVCVIIPATPNSLQLATTCGWTTPRKNAARSSNVYVTIPATPDPSHLATTCRWTTPRVISMEPITPISPCSMFSLEPFESINGTRTTHTWKPDQGRACLSYFEKIDLWQDISVKDVEGSGEVQCPQIGEEWLHLPYGR